MGNVIVSLDSGDSSDSFGTQDLMRETFNGRQINSTNQVSSESISSGGEGSSYKQVECRKEEEEDLSLKELKELPVELFIEIFRFLSAQEIMLFGAVCRFTYRLTNVDYIWRERCENEYTIKQLEGNVKNWKELYLKLRHIRWSSLHSDTRGIFVSKDGHTCGNRYHQLDYSNIRTEHYLRLGLVHEWCVEWTGTLKCNIHIGIGDDDFDYKLRGGCNRTIGRQGGIGVLVGVHFDVVNKDRYLYTRNKRKRMETNIGDKLWFKFDCRKKKNCVLYFAQNEQKYFRVAKVKYKKYYPAMSIFLKFRQIFTIRRMERGKDQKKKGLPYIPYEPPEQ